MNSKPDTNKMPDILVWIVRERLSDGSHVYNVVFGDEKLPAEDDAAANELAGKIVDAINEHTVKTADVMFDY